MTPNLAAPVPLSDEVLDLARTLDGAGHEVWCVGGALRDFLLGDPRGDVDLATSARPEEVLRLFRRTVPVGVRHGTVGVLDRVGGLHEVTTFRHDVRTDGRHAEVAFGASLEEDLARRDFTINALAYHPLRGEWRDPAGGAADLQAGVIRAVGSAAERFREDYLRILRGLRFAARFGFRIAPDTWAGMVAGAAGLTVLSAERVRDEWMKGLRTARSVAEFVRLWRDSGAAAVLLPELRADRSLAAADESPRDPVLLTALLVQDPAAVLLRLRCANADIARASRLDAAPAAPPAGDPVSVRRWMAAAGDAVDDLIETARLRQGSPPAWAATVAGIRARGEATDRGGLAVSGADLIAAGVPPGPAIGRILDRLVDAVLEEPGRNTREALLALAREPA